MNLKILYGVVASLAAALGAVVTFKPESIFNDNYTFFQYALSVLAVPLLLMGLLVLALLLLASLPGADSALQSIWAWRELSFKALPKAVASHGVVPLVVCIAMLSWASYEGYRLARNSYSFTRDKLFPQYRLELLARHTRDFSDGNLYAAKQGYAEYADRFKGLQTAAESATSVQDIERMLAVKNGLAARARDRDKTFGVNRTSLHWKVEALNIHPWDSSLRTEVERDLTQAMNSYLPLLLADAPLCAARATLPADRTRLGRHLALLGFERAVDAGIRGSRPEDWRDRFCDFVGTGSRERIAALVEGIWQRRAIEAMVLATKPELLEEGRRRRLAEMRQSEAKWRWFFDRPGSNEELVPTAQPDFQPADTTSDPPPPPKMLKETE